MAKASPWSVGGWNWSGAAKAAGLPAASPQNVLYGGNPRLPIPNPYPDLPPTPPAPRTPPTPSGPLGRSGYQPSGGGGNWPALPKPSFDPNAFMSGLNIQSGGGGGGSWQQYADKIQQYDPAQFIADRKAQAADEARNLGLQTAHSAGMGGFATNEYSTPFAATMTAGLGEITRGLNADISKLELEAMQMNNESYLKLAQLAQEGDAQAQDAMFRLAGLNLEAQGQAWQQQMDVAGLDMDRRQFDESVRQFEAEFGLKTEELGMRKDELDRQYAFDQERFDWEKQTWGEEMALKREQARREWWLMLHQYLGNNNPGSQTYW